MDKVKKEIIEKINNNIPISQIMNEYNISRSTLYYWKKLYTVHSSRHENKFTYSDIITLQNELKRKNRQIEIYEKAGCFKTSSLKIRLEAIEKLFGLYPVKEMCRIFNVKVGTFYNHHFRRVDKTTYEIKDEQLKPIIKEIFEKSKSRFGAKKIEAKLKDLGYITSEKKIHNLMKELNLSPLLITKKQKYPSGNYNPFYKNMLLRKFTQDAPNKVWVSDIATIKVNGNSYYVCIVIDLFSRKIVGAKASYINNSNLVINTFKAAYEKRNEPKDLMFHSDRGTQYTAYEFCNLLKSLDVLQSFSNVGNPYDNAVAESFFSFYRKEELNRMVFTNFYEVKQSLEEYVKFYNDYRPHNTLKNKTPNQFEKEFYEK